MSVVLHCGPLRDTWLALLYAVMLGDGHPSLANPLPARVRGASLLSCTCGAGASPGQHPDPTFFAPSLTFLACGSLLVLITGQSSLAPAWPHLPGPEILDTLCVCHMRPGSARYLLRLLYVQPLTTPPTCAPMHRVQRVWVPKSEARSPRDHQLPHTCLGIGSTSPDPSSNVFSG